MRLLLISLSILSAGHLRVCGKDDAGGRAASASAEVAATASAAPSVKASVAPRIGGNVVAAGDFSVEVALHRSGQIEALVVDQAGKLVSEGVKLSVSAQTRAGAEEKVELAFDGPRACFRGRARAELASGPIEVALDVGGKAVVGKLALAAALPEPRFGGYVLAAGGFNAELFVGADGQVQAFIRDSAGVDIEGGGEATFKVRLRAKGGVSQEIALAFDSPNLGFIGRAKAGVELEPGPLEFLVEAGGQVHVGGLERIALRVDASHGGAVVLAGDYSVELVAKGPEIQAFVFDASGKAHAAGDLDLNLDIGAGLPGAATSLKLAWDAPSLSYKARASGDLDLWLQPLRLTLKAGGKAFVSAAASLKGAALIAHSARLDAKAKVAGDLDAKLAAAADAKAKVQAPDLKAKAAAAVKVEPPKVNVSLTKSASASAGAKAGGGAKAGAGAKAGGGFSLGTK